MGTNFFARPRHIPTKEDIEFFAQIAWKPSIINDEEIQVKLQTYIKEPIHIGKSSSGWKFLFDFGGGNPKHWSTDDRRWKSKQELIDFLKDAIITDEYENPWDFESFWNRVDSKQNDGSHIDHNDYAYLVDDIEVSVYSNFC